MSKKILFLMPYPSWEINRLKQFLSDYEIIVPNHYLTQQEVLKYHRDVQIVIPVNNTRLLDSYLINSLPNLRLIQQVGTGIEGVDLKMAEEKGVYVALAVGPMAQAVAELTFLLILSLYCKLKELLEFMQKRMYIKENWPPRHLFLRQEICNKTIGVIGFGAVGKAVANIARNGFQMKVLVYDPYVSEEVINQLGCVKVDLETLLRESDIVSINCILTEETRKMINEDRLKLMKKTAILINTARGEVVDEKALVKALREGLISGAGLDVYEKEPPQPDNPLLDLPNVVATPHIGGNTREAKIRIQDIVIENVRRLERGEKLLHQIIPRSHL
jgi:D-3-phosphoglycerate dehydrogenase